MFLSCKFCEQLILKYLFQQIGETVLKSRKLLFSSPKKPENDYKIIAIFVPKI